MPPTAFFGAAFVSVVFFRSLGLRRGLFGSGLFSRRFSGCGSFLFYLLLARRALAFGLLFFVRRFFSGRIFSRRLLRRRLVGRDLFSRFLGLSVSLLFTRRTLALGLRFLFRFRRGVRFRLGRRFGLCF